MKIIDKGESPFKFWVFENAIDSKLAQMIFTELTSIGDDVNYHATMYKYDNVFEKKLAQDKLELMPPTTKAWLMWTLTQNFVSMIETITGIDGLIPDPWLRGGGFHLHTQGGILKPHLDFTMHPKLKLVRRLNFIVYFNKNYDPSWGGELELWNKEMTVCEKKIQPGYNIGVLFETPDAAHGFSVPWSAPEGITRKSLAVYLYSSPTADDLLRPHRSTQFLRRADEEINPEMEALREKRNSGRLSTNV